MADVPIRFCPFCRDPYEGEARCPEHDLPLVPLEALPRRQEPLTSDTRLALFSPRAGRWALWLAGVSLWLAPALPWFHVRWADRAWTVSGYALALGRAMNVWIVPAVGGAWFFLLRRMRTPARMRAVRPAVALLTPLPLVSVVLTWHRIASGLEAVRGAGFPTALEPRGGLLLLLLGVGLSIWAALRLGRSPEEPRALDPGPCGSPASPEEDHGE